MPNPYASATSLDERMKLALTSMRNAGVDQRKALLIVALSGNEAAGAFFMDRGPTSKGSILLPIICYPVRQILALERGRPDTNTGLLASWLNNDLILSTLRSNGWISQSGDKYFASGELAAYDSVSNPNQALAYMFELIFDNRIGGALGAFSVGPTQMFLGLSRLAGGTMNSRFSSWDSLWKFYKAESMSQLMDSEAWNCYPTNVAWYPTNDSSACGNSDSNSCVEKYLEQYQTGYVDWSNANWRSYAQRFANYLDKVYQLAQGIYL